MFLLAISSGVSYIFSMIDQNAFTFSNFSDAVNFLPSFTLSLAPLLAVCFLIKIISGKTSFVQLCISCILGLLALIPVQLMQIFAGPFLYTIQGSLLFYIVFNGLLEETFKMSVLFFIPHKKLSVSEFFLCAFLSGFTLGYFEFLIYFFNGYPSLLRLFTAVPLHAACAGLSGFFVYSVKIKSRTFLPFILSVVSHGIYNYFASFKETNFIFYFSFVVILFVLVECRSWYLKFKEA